MGKSLEVNPQKNKYIILSDFDIRSNNRGTAALGYGAIKFLLQNGYIDNNYTILKISFYRNPFRKINKYVEKELDIYGVKWRHVSLNVFIIDKYLLKYKMLFWNRTFKQAIRNLELVAAINGGDGLTDIYGNYMLYARLREINLATYFHIPYIILPQTIGPFLEERNKDNILKVLRGAEKVFVRDHNFDSELKQANIPFENTNDLSFFMKPMSFPVEIKHPAVGINLSGLAYSNKFGNLVGQFDNYPLLIESLINNFKGKGFNVYIIPHSYNIQTPEENNDDMLSSKEFYDRLKDKRMVFLI